MDPNKDIPLKVYLFWEASDECEIRRFSVQLPLTNRYAALVDKISHVFPGLCNKVFTIYWKDEEGDEVAVSSDEELSFAIKALSKEPVMRLFVRTQSEMTNPKEDESDAVHLGVYCDGCDKNIAGIRFKCGLCSDYDLCSRCREAGIHDEHPMYRIPQPTLFDRNLGLGFTIGRHRSRRHSDKKKKCDKRESGPETGDESEDVHHHGKHHHKKMKKAYKCAYKREFGKCEKGDETNGFCRAGPYSQMVNEFMRYFNPVNFQTPAQNGNQNGAEFPSHVSYLRNLGTTLQKVLDPLGVNVEFEVREKDAKKNEKNEEKQPTGTTPTAPPQKEVRFNPKEAQEKMKEKIDEITKILSNQTVSNGNDGNGWVSFEELKRDSEEPKPSSSSSGGGETPKPTTTAATNTTESKKEEQTNLYPNLEPRVPTNPAVRNALESMLAMGFTNEGNWLGSLLEAKNGDISQALEALAFQNKVNK